MSKNQEQFLNRTAYPSLGASFRKASNKSDKPVKDLNKKLLVTFASADFSVHLVAYGTAEELQPYVRDPESFILNRAKTVIIVLDETPLWLKVKGDEKLLVSTAECRNQKSRQLLKQKLKRAKTTTEKRMAEFELAAWAAQCGREGEHSEMVGKGRHWYDI